MDVFCQKCQLKVGQIADEKIPAGRTASVKCPKCGEKIILSRAVPEKVSDTTPEEPTATASDQTTDQADQAAPPETPARSKTAEISDYDFTIGEIIKEAWQKTKGVKGPLWGACFLAFLAVLVVTGLLGMIAGTLANSTGAALGAAMQITVSIAMYPFLAGIMMIGIRRSVDLPVNWKMAFGYFSFLLPIVISAFLVGIFTTLGFLLLIIPGIYLTLAYMLVIPLIVDKEMGPWEAMETSRKAISKHWFKIFGLYFVMGLIYIISMIPLGIGVIWTMPMMIMVGSILYREIFGVSESA